MVTYKAVTLSTKHMNANSHLVLASASPQRKTLLEGLGLSFEVIPSQFNESDHVEHDPVKRSLALGELKAKDVALRNADSWVIGCDTLVVAPDGTLLEKPNDMDDARRMLQKQSGGTSQVHSGLCVVAPGGESASAVSSSSVTFKKLSSEEIDWWMHTKLWEGRSGSFQIDGLGQLMIERIEGDWASVVGLPVFLLGELFQKLKAPYLSW